MRLPPSVAGYFAKLPPGQRLAWLLGASALLHVLAFQLAGLLPERRVRAPERPIPVTLVPAPPREAPPAAVPDNAVPAAPPAIEAPQEETAEPRPAPAETVSRPVRQDEAEDDPEEEAAPDEEAETPGVSLVAPDGAAPRYAPLNEGESSGRLAPFRDGLPPGAALDRAVRSLECRKLDPDDPEHDEVCAGVTPAELVDRDMPVRVIREAEFEAILEQRREMRRRNAEQPMDMAPEKPGCVLGVSGADC